MQHNRDRENPHESPLPHHPASGSAQGGSSESFRNQNPLDLSGAENFFESHDGWPGRPKQRLKPIAFVRLPEKPQDRCLGENPLFIRVSGVFCTTKDKLYES
jgi:hypothetical protein